MVMIVALWENKPPDVDAAQTQIANVVARLIKQNLMTEQFFVQWESNESNTASVRIRELQVQVQELRNEIVGMRRVEMVTSEATASFIAPTVDRDVTTCTYGPIPEIKPPM